MIGFVISIGRGINGRSFLRGDSALTSNTCSSNAVHTRVAKTVRTIESKRNSGRSKAHSSPSESRRPNRVSELLRRELGLIIDDTFARTFRRAEGAPALLISVVAVKCSDDLRSARVNMSIFGTDEDRLEVMTWLRQSRKEIRFAVAQAVSMKYIPDLSFSESEMGAAVKTVNILNQLAREREAKADDVDDDEAGGKVAVDEWTSEEGEGDLDYDASGDDGLIFEDDDDEDEAELDDEEFIIEVEDADVASEKEFVERNFFNRKSAENMKR